MTQTRNTRVALAVGLALASSLAIAQQSESNDSVALEEVTVTAQRREESLQKAAAAISVVDAEALARSGATETENLNKLVPGLAVGLGGPSSQIYLRGVGSYGTNAFADPAVAFTVDGIAYGRVTGMNGNFFDLQRIEVLKGPQGTLYGRNATGGAINVIPNKPQLGEMQGGVGVEAGNYSLKRINGYLNLPAGERFALRGAFQVVDRDGYQSDGTNDEDSKAFRLQGLWQPTDGTSLLLYASKVELGGKGFGQIPYGRNGYFNNDDPWTGPAIANPAALVAQATSNNQPPTLFTNGVSYAQNRQDIEVTSIGATFNAELGAAGVLTFIANQIETTNFSNSYGPGFRFAPDDNSKQRTFEARLNGESGALQWVAGLFAYDEDQSFRFWVDQGFLFNQTGADIRQLDDKTEAIFGQLTYSVNDALRLTAGLRFTQEEKVLSGQIFNRQGAPCAALGATPATIATIAAVIPWAARNESGVAYPFPYCRDTTTGNRDWNDTSWKVGVEYDVAERSMLYANVARGFKAGGFYAAGDNSVVGNDYEPEELVAFTVGSKNSFLDNRLRLNAEVFYWDYQDHQESYLAPTNAPVPAFGFITINVPKAEIYGLDLELEALLTEADRISVRAQYLKAEYTDFVFNVARPGEFAANAPGTQPPSTTCGVTFVSIGLYRLDCGGKQMPRSPTTSIQADYQHTFNLAGGSKIIPGVSVQMSSSYVVAADYNPLQKQDSFTMVDADIAWVSADERWTVAAFGKNLSDEDVWQNSFVHPSGLAFNALRPPRTYGARVSFKF